MNTDESLIKIVIIPPPQSQSHEDHVLTPTSSSHCDHPSPLWSSLRSSPISTSIHHPNIPLFDDDHHNETLMITIPSRCDIIISSHLPSFFEISHLHQMIFNLGFSKHKTVAFFPAPVNPHLPLNDVTISCPGSSCHKNMGEWESGGTTWAGSVVT